MNPTLITVLAVLLLALPLAGALVNALLGPRLGRSFVNVVGPLSVLLAFIVGTIALVSVIGAPETGKSLTVNLWQWLDLGAGNLRAGLDITIDPLSALMVMVITGVGFLIHVFSIGYMEHDPGVARFFSYMNLFIFSMLLLVLAANLVILIIGWALVALSSYLLIGFWYERASAVTAARKAFITQVIGDVGLVLAAFILFTTLRGADAHGPLYLPTIFANAHASYGDRPALVTAICILLAIGAFAKSAQFPLHTWLPDAMEGPTPVSALIHAATMVTAGVYLIARFSALFDLAPIAAGMVACVGMGTAVMAGVIALSQIDIKRVIAYSTMSQIGLMIFATGIGAYGAAMFHFTTHAVFKALLFMAAGNVIHALGDEQDIRAMGGVARSLKVTNVCFLTGSFALAGIPIFAGFFSKEELLGLGAVHGPAAPLLWIVGVGVNVLTGLYAFRLYFDVFHGEPRTARVFAARESPRSMLLPVSLLAAGAVSVGLLLFPGLPGIAGLNVIGNFLDPVFTGNGGQLLSEPAVGIATITLIIGTLASFLGIGLAYRWCYQRRPDAATIASRLPRLLPQLSLHKFYFDELYDATLVRPSRTVARSMRRVVEPEVMDGWIRGLVSFFGQLSIDLRSYQSGKIRDYAGWIGLGAIGFTLVTVLIISR